MTTKDEIMVAGEAGNVIISFNSVAVRNQVNLIEYILKAILCQMKKSFLDKEV